MKIREWLRTDPTRTSFICIDTYFEDDWRPTNKEVYLGDLTFADCNRQVMYELYAYDQETLKEQMEFVDRIREHLLNLRADMEAAYDRLPTKSERFDEGDN